MNHHRYPNLLLHEVSKRSAIERLEDTGLEVIDLTSDRRFAEYLNNLPETVTIRLILATTTDETHPADFSLYYMDNKTNKVIVVKSRKMLGSHKRKSIESIVGGIYTLTKTSKGFELVKLWGVDFSDTNEPHQENLAKQSENIEKMLSRLEIESEDSIKAEELSNKEIVDEIKQGIFTNVDNISNDNAIAQTLNNIVYKGMDQLKSKVEGEDLINLRKLIETTNVYGKHIETLMDSFDAGTLLYDVDRSTEGPNY